MSIDFRYLALLLRASSDPVMSLGDFSRGVRVGQGGETSKTAGALSAEEEMETA